MPLTHIARGALLAALAAAAGSGCDFSPGPDPLTADAGRADAFKLSAVLGVIMFAGRVELYPVLNAGVSLLTLPYRLATGRIRPDPTPDR